MVSDIPYKKAGDVSWGERYGWMSHEVDGSKVDDQWVINPTITHACIGSVTTILYHGS